MNQSMKNHIKRAFELVTLLSVIVLGSSFLSSSKLDPAKEVAPHVVAFKLISKGNGRYATGFHMEYNDKVYIVTNKHVCDANIRIYGHKYIQFNDYVGEILAIDTKHDLCLVTSNRDRGLKLADKKAENMDKVILVGHPRGIGLTIREGRIIGNEIIATPWLDNFITLAQRISCIGYRGNSGSPVVNEYGKVVGVLFAGSPSYPTEPFIVPFEYLVMFLEQNT